MAGNVTNKTLTYLNTHPKATSNLFSSNSALILKNIQTIQKPICPHNLLQILF